MTPNILLFDSPECFGPLIEVISVPSRLANEGNFGAGKNAQLTVMGRIQNVSCSNGDIHSNDDGEIIGNLSLDDADFFSWEDVASVFMLPIAICGTWVGERPSDSSHRSWHALALMEVLKESRTYYRIGYVSDTDTQSDGYPQRSWDFLFAASLQQIVLI